MSPGPSKVQPQTCRLVRAQAWGNWGLAVPWCPALPCPCPGRMLQESGPWTKRMLGRPGQSRQQPLQPDPPGCCKPTGALLLLEAICPCCNGPQCHQGFAGPPMGQSQ